MKLLFVLVALAVVGYAVYRAKFRKKPAAAFEPPKTPDPLPLRESSQVKPGPGTEAP